MSMFAIREGTQKLHNFKLLLVLYIHDCMVKVLQYAVIDLAIISFYCSFPLTVYCV